MRIIDGIAPASCGACGHGWHTDACFVLQTDDDGDYTTCPTCARRYRRVGGSCRFESPDGHRVFVPEATAAAAV